MAARLDLRERFLQLGVAALAILLGIGAGVDPRIAVAAAVGLAFVALVMNDLTIGLVLFLIVYSAVRTPRQLAWTIGAYVAGSALAAGYGVLNPPTDTAYYDVTRVSGTIGDPNELAGVLVGGTILAAALAATLKGAPVLRILSGLASALCGAGIFLSLSRGGLVALAFSLVAAVIVAGRRWRLQAIGLALVVAAGAFVYFGFYADQTAASRVTSFGNGTGRTDIWTVGWRMVEAHPVRGVGVGNYQTTSIHYLLKPGAIERDEFIVDTPKVAHNTYLQVLAELGIVGATMFLAIVGFSLLCILKAARIFERLGDETMELMSRALLVSLCGVLAADFFISEEFSKQLWLLLGLGPALLGIARAATGRRAT